MKKHLLLFLLLSFVYTSFAQSDAESGYLFTPVKELKITPVKSQDRTGTCWCFSSIAFMEAELLRMNKGEYDLSEMFVVFHTYMEKAQKYIRTQGASRFSEGGMFPDPMFVLKNFGMLPKEVMTGLQYGETVHVHGELTSILKAYLDAVTKNRNGKLSIAWLQGYRGILESYLGKIPKEFNYKGKTYTPQTFATSLGLNTDDYVYLTSFNHHPFYSYCQLEVPDNWMWASYYNLPLDDFVSTIDNAINAGYTVAWDADVSEKGFTRNGIAIVPDVNMTEMSGSDQARWLGLSQAERDAQLFKLEAPGYEKVITQENRQEAFENYQTTEDHLMLIFGIAKDQKGNKYYMVKNSWGTGSKYKGIWYVSEAYVRYKTITLMLHKNGVPAAIAKRMVQK